MTTGLQHWQAWSTCAEQRRWQRDGPRHADMFGRQGGREGWTHIHPYTLIHQSRRPTRSEFCGGMRLCRVSEWCAAVPCFPPRRAPIQRTRWGRFAFIKYLKREKIPPFLYLGGWLSMVSSFSSKSLRPIQNILMCLLILVAQRWQGWWAQMWILYFTSK